MRSQARRYGNLNCRLVDALGEGGSPEWVVVLMHGYGAPGEDLVPIGAELLARSEALRAGARFVFPEAPLDLSAMGMFGARAWWPIDVERFFDPRRMAELLDPESRQEPPEGLAEARAAAESMLAALREETGLGPERFVLGGFSQGSMLACELGLLGDEPPAAMVLWSSMPIHRAAWSPAARDRAGLRVFQSHGRSDDVIPYRLGEELHELLDGAGLDVTYVPFDGPHGIAPNVLEAFLEWIDGVLADAEPSRG